MMNWRQSDREKEMIDWLIAEGILLHDAVDVVNCMHDMRCTLPQAMQVVLFEDDEDEDDDDDDDEDDESEDDNASEDKAWWQYMQEITREQLRIIEAIIKSKDAPQKV